jgi:formylglycine-generating enzyme required for sulfatase activity
VSGELDPEEEFLEAVDLSPPPSIEKGGGSASKWVWGLAGCLSLWTLLVYVWFSREKETPAIEIPIEEGVQVPETATATPTPLAMPTPTPEMLQVRVQSDPPGATVLREDQYQGLTPLALENARPGQQLLFQLPGYEALRVTLSEKDLKDGLQVILPPVLGRIRLQVFPPETELMLDGKALTLPADGLLELPLRPHTFSAKAAGYVSQTTAVTPAKAYERNLVLRLQPLPTPTPVLLPGEEAAHEKAAVIQAQGIEMIRPEFPLEAVLGSARGTPGRQSNEVSYQVKLSREFRIAKTEVSNAQFRKFKPGYDSGRWQGVDLNADALPVVNITWQEAAAFCNWLSEQEGLPPAYVEKDGNWEFQEKPGTGYRLPTEAEWESVARLEQKQALFGWGDKMPPPEGKVNVAGAESRKLQGTVLADYKDAFAGPAAVDAAGAGPMDILGLYGNVSEWVQDSFSIPQESRKVIENPLNSAAGKYHVIKGASWRDTGIADLRIARRRYHDQPAVDVGFRVARYVQSN